MWTHARHAFKHCEVGGVVLRLWKEVFFAAALCGACRPLIERTISWTRRFWGSERSEAPVRSRRRECVLGFTLLNAAGFFPSHLPSLVEQCVIRLLTGTTNVPLSSWS